MVKSVNTKIHEKTGSIEKEFKVRYHINSLIYHIGYLRRDLDKLAKEFKQHLELFDNFPSSYLKTTNDMIEILNRLEKDFRIIDDMIENPPIERMEGGISWLDCGNDIKEE